MGIYEFLRTLVQPSHFLMVLTLLGVSSCLRFARFGRALLGLGLGGLLITGIWPVGGWLAAPLESRFPPPATPPLQVDGIVVLGGFTDPVTGCRGPMRLNDAAERLVETLLLARRYPKARILLAGGGWQTVPGCSEAEIAAAILERAGIDRRRLWLETRSRTTWENARFAHALARPGPAETWLLVTSAAHMPRAMGAFRRLGWQVVPWPVDPIAVPFTLRPPWPELPRRWRELDLAVHEWLGLLWYRWKGRIGDG